MSQDNLPALLPIGNSLAYVESDGQILFSSREIGEQLGYANPEMSINVLYSRNRMELQEYIKLIYVNGREKRHFTEEGVYIISMLANTEKARDFRARLAKFLRQIRQGRLELAREAGYQQGHEAALTLPVMEAQHKKGWLEGYMAGKKEAESKDRLLALQKIASYISKGLTYTEIAKILGVSKSTIGCRIARAKKLGFWPHSRPSQASFMEVAR